VPIRLISLLLVLATGCSFITVRGAPSKDPGVRPVDCTRSRFAPVADTVPAAILLGIATIAFVQAAGKDEGEEGSKLGGFLVGTVFGIGGLPFALSAWYGFARTGRCRAMNAAPLPSAP
jgi:hypothetical protein